MLIHFSCLTSKTLEFICFFNHINSLNANNVFFCFDEKKSYNIPFILLKVFKKKSRKTKVHIHTLKKKSVTGHRKPPQFPRPNVNKNKEKNIVQGLTLFIRSLEILLSKSPGMRASCHLPRNFKKVFNEENVDCRLLFL